MQAYIYELAILLFGELANVLYVHDTSFVCNYNVMTCLYKLAYILDYACMLQETHRLYRQKLEEVSKLQDTCSTSISRQRKRLKELAVSLEE